MAGRTDADRANDILDNIRDKGYRNGKAETSIFGPPGSPPGGVGAQSPADAAKAKGAKILREAGPMNAGTTIIAFIEDPDGYPIELLGKK